MTKTKLTLCSLAALLTAGQAFAHTGVRDVATEGVASYNGFTITHGCAAAGEGSVNPPPEDLQQYPVLGQSAVFPFGDHAVWRDSTGTVIQVGGNGNGTISQSSLSLAVTGYSSTSSSFATAQEIVDNLGNVQGLLWKDGAMEPKLNTITPFKITAPTIVDNCTRLKIRIGVINYCDVGKNADNDATGPFKQPKDAFKRVIPKLSINGSIQKNVADSGVFGPNPAGNGDNNRQDWWFPAPYGGSALFTDPEVLQPTYWTTMSVIGTPAQVATCPVDANGNTIFTDVTVEPDAYQFDTYLNTTNTQPFTTTPGSGGM